MRLSKRARIVLVMGGVLAIPPAVVLLIVMMSRDADLPPGGALVSFVPPPGSDGPRVYLSTHDAGRRELTRKLPLKLALRGRKYFLELERDGRVGRQEIPLPSDGGEVTVHIRPQP